MSSLPTLTDGDTCPHCGARAIVEPSAALRWACGVCGGARILGLAAPPGGPVVASLVRARQTRAAAIGWSVAAIALGVGSAMTAGLALLLAFTWHFAAVIVAAVSVILALFAWNARRSGARGKTQWTAELDAAYAAAAEQIARERGGAVTAAELASAMRIDVTMAEATLGALAVQSNVRVDVGDDAELHYRVDTGATLPATEITTDASADPARRAQREP